MMKEYRAYKHKVSTVHKILPQDKCLLYERPNDIFVNSNRNNIFNNKQRKYYFIYLDDFTGSFCFDSGHILWFITSYGWIIHSSFI